jgi:biopolymer transport protein ExbB/TolQ
MAGLLALLILAGLFIWLIWYLFFRSVLWVAEPLIEYFKDKEAEQFSIEDIGKDEFDDSDLESIPKNKVKVTIKDFSKLIHLSKTLLKKAQKQPQKLGNSNLWIYKDYIFNSKPTQERIKEIFESDGK